MSITMFLTRRELAEDYTAGTLVIGGATFHTIEPPDFMLENVSVSQYAELKPAAIPAGTYNVQITDSFRFKRPLPLVLNVPGFEGIRIHPGNSVADTEGCILPGLYADQIPGRISSSRIATDRIIWAIRKAGGAVLIVRRA